MKHIVVLIPISTYDQSAVDAAVRQGVELLGGIGLFVQPDEKIVLKPNLLARALPQRAITTHPAVFSAVCKLLRGEGYAHLSYGDSPGNPATTPDKAAEGAGITEAAEKYGVEKADFATGSIVPFPEGRTAKSFYLCRGVQEADAYINVCKMKTHALERITGGRLFRNEQRVSWVCLACGQIHTGCEPPPSCSGCSGGQGHFIRSSFYPFAVEG